MIENGRYVVLEGADYVGKTTQINLLKEYVAENGIDAVFLNEPGGSPFGNEVRKLLFYPPEKISPITQLHLFTANRLHLWETIIQPGIDAGKTVISDRSWYSTLAYQGYGGSISPETVRNITEGSLPERYITPDAVAILDLDNTERQRRKRLLHNPDAKLDALESEPDEYFERVYEGYRHIVATMGAVAVNASGTPQEVFGRLRRILLPS